MIQPIEIITHNQKSKFLELYNGSYYTITGAGGDLQNWITKYTDMLTEHGIGTPNKWFTFSGRDVNIVYNLDGERFRVILEWDSFDTKMSLAHWQNPDRIIPLIRNIPDSAPEPMAETEFESDVEESDEPDDDARNEIDTYQNVISELIKYAIDNGLDMVGMREAMIIGGMTLDERG